MQKPKSAIRIDIISRNPHFILDEQFLKEIATVNYKGICMKGAYY